MSAPVSALVFEPRPKPPPAPGARNTHPTEPTAKAASDRRPRYAVGTPFLAARSEAGGAGVRALFRRIRIWRVGAGWYLVALGLFPAIYVAGTAVYTLF